MASGIPEPLAVALATIALTAVGLMGQRRRSRKVVFGGSNEVNVQRVLSAAVFFCTLLAASSAWSQAVVQVRRDDFGNDAMPHAQQFDFTTGMVPAGGIWNGIHNPTNGGGDLGGTFVPAVFVRDGFNFDNSIDKAGKLHVEDLALHLNSNAGLGTGWEPQGDKNNSPFLFTTMDAYYDFDAIVKIDAQTAGNWSYAGLIARVAGPPVNICCGQDAANSFGTDENFVTVGAFRTDAANVGNASLLLQNTVNGGAGGGGSPGEVNTDLAPAGAAGASPIWVRVLKRGGSITGASSADGTTWLEPANAVVVNPGAHAYGAGPGDAGDRPHIPYLRSRHLGFGRFRFLSLRSANRRRRPMRNGIRPPPRLAAVTGMRWPTGRQTFRQPSQPEHHERAVGRIDYRAFDDFQ